MRKTRNKGAGALRPIDIMDHNIPSSLDRAFKPQITVIRARKMTRPRTGIDRLMDEKTNTGIFNMGVKYMNRCIKGVVSGIVEGTVERLLNGKERNLRNSGVSKQGSHDSIATFPHILLQNIQFFIHNSGEVGRAMLEAFMMLREQGWRRERASVWDGGGGVGWEAIETVE